MTSVLRGYATRKEGLTRFIKPESPCYDNGTDTVLFPFTVTNGVLDISYSGNNFKTQMVDTTNVDPIAETGSAIAIFGGPYLVNSLGNNFKDYIRAWRDGTIDAGSPIEIYVAPQMLQVQEIPLTNVNANSGAAYTISTQRPTGDTFIGGNELNNYQVTYVFKTPLTFTIVESGVTQYITFRTILDQE